jgi:hypothetical protein
MPATRGKFSPLLAPGLAAIFFQQLKLRSTEHTKFMNMKTSRRAYEEEYKITGLGSMYRKSEGGVYTFDEPISGDTIRYTHLTYGLGFRITQEMMEDDLYGVMTKMSKWLARSTALNREVQAFSVLNNAFSTSYLGLDGKKLCASDHPRLDGGGTQSNLSSADFSLTELQTAIEAYENLTDDRGFKVDVTPKYLVHGPSLIWEVNKVLGSEYQPDSADNNINVVRSKYNIVPMLVHYLTDSDSWYLLADKGNHDMKMWNRVSDQFKNDDDPLTGDALFTARHRLSVGFGDWRGVYGSAGA